MVRIGGAFLFASVAIAIINCAMAMLNLSGPKWWSPVADCLIGENPWHFVLKDVAAWLVLFGLFWLLW